VGENKIETDWISSRAPAIAAVVNAPPKTSPVATMKALVTVP